MTQRLRALVVEDEPNNQEVARVILEAAGHTVTIVGDGSDAVRLCIDEGQEFDIVLMDMAMPKMGGDEATRRLRAHPATKDLPILCVSAKASGANRSEGLAAGCDHYITKPYRNRDLLAAVAHTMSVAAERAGKTPS